MNRQVVACVVAALLSPTIAAAGEPPKIAPLGSGQPMALEGSFGFTGKKEETLRRSASGIACLGAKNCLVAFDEGREARRAELSPTVYRAGAAVALPADGKEGDAEAVAAEGGRFFVTGSHSVKRTSCKPNDASRFLARIAADGGAEPGSVLTAIDAVPVLKAALGKCLTDGGLDIEGLAATTDHLWFGFRGPAAPAGAYALRVDQSAVFEKGDPRPTLFTVDVGAGRTIRDMQAVGDKLLLLAGPPKGVDDAIGYALVLFDPEAASGGSRVLARLDYSKVEPRSLPGCADEALEKVKPESLMVEDVTASPLRVAILSDGLCDGGPLWFEVAP